MSSTEKDYDEKYFDNFTDVEGDRSHSWNYLIEEFIPELSPSSVVLDIGCATGLFLELLRKKYSLTEIYGVDISSWAIEQCKKNIKGTFAAIDMNEQDLPFGDEKFDLIVSLAVIEHLTNEDKYLENIYSSLKPGGYFFFSCPMKSGILRKILDKDETHINLQNSAYYKKRLKQLGFELIKTKRIALWGWPPTANLRERFGYSKPIESKLDIFSQDQEYLFRKPETKE